MKQEDKNLLLQDLCGRLPYGVKCKIGNHNYVICDISLEKQYDVFHESGRAFPIGVIGTEDNGNTFYTDVYEKHVKPYLFPISGMTEEQIEEAKTYFWKDVDYGKSLIDKGINCFYPCFNILEFYHKNHLDYRGLIPKGLAIDCTNLNIY